MSKQDAQNSLFIYSYYLETIISDYLKVQVKNNPQNILKQFVQFHYEDEKIHRKLFRDLYSDYLSKSYHETDFIEKKVIEISESLYSVDLNIWEELMKDNNIKGYSHLLGDFQDKNFKCKHAEKIYQELKRVKTEC
ncbi:hypothetical protein N9818_00740 [Arcobacteraceae bacterium]|nr:hypothetical protein [Arcobacteraceae bacterium]